MAAQKVITAIDLGSSKIRAVIATAEAKRNTINVIGVGVAPSNGIRKGRITDIDEAVANITAALEEAERMSGTAVHRAYIGVSGTMIRSDDCQGVVAISGSNAEISEEDVDRVLDAARSVSMPANREILRIIPKTFAVDGQRNIKYPVGMTGIRLEVEAHIISGETGAMKNLEKTLYQTGIDTDELVPSFLSCSEALLDRRQKDLGVVLIEMGASSTSIAVFEEGSVMYSMVLPVGGEHATNDLAIGMRASVDTAEKIKLQYGTCLVDSVSDRDEVDLSVFSQTDTHSVNHKLIANILEARYREVFEMVREELQHIGKDGMLPSGAVLCGGAVKLEGVQELAREVLGLPVKIALPRDVEGIIDRVSDPSFAHIIGLLHFGSRYGASPSMFSFDTGKIWKSIVDFFKSLLP